MMNLYKIYIRNNDLDVAELAPPHAQSAQGFRGERVQATGLAACCNYFSKKKKKNSLATIKAR